MCEWVIISQQSGSSRVTSWFPSLWRSGFGHAHYLFCASCVITRSVYTWKRSKWSIVDRLRRRVSPGDKTDVNIRGVKDERVCCHLRQGLRGGLYRGRSVRNRRGSSGENQTAPAGQCDFSKLGLHTDFLIISLKKNHLLVNLAISMASVCIWNEFRFVMWTVYCFNTGKCRHIYANKIIRLSN